MNGQKAELNAFEKKTKAQLDEAKGEAQRDRGARTKRNRLGRTCRSEQFAEGTRRP